MTSFQVDISGIERLRTRLQEMPAEMQQLIDAEISDGVEAIAAEARQRAPANDGILRNEIVTGKAGPMNYSVSSLALYSAYVEFGTRANVQIPDGLEAYASQFIGSPVASSLSAKEAIFTWCENKGIEKSAWYAIYITLMTKGGQPHPFFFPAVNRILPIIQNRILRALTANLFKEIS